MPYEQRSGQINLFLNRNKRAEGKGPDFKPRTGETINLDGQDYDVAVWKKQTKNGDEYLYLSIKEPYQR